MDHYAENLPIFEYAHEKGYFFLLHPDIPKYKPYTVFPEFEEISERDLKIRAQVNAESKTTYIVNLPKNYTSEKRWPLLLIFHGGGSNLDRVQKHWQSETLKSGYIKVYLQSYNHYDTETYGWRSGDNIADIEIFRIFIAIIKEYPIDYEKIILAGISAGATYAIDVAIRNVIPANGIIAFCPGIPKDLKIIEKREKINTAVKIFMVGGENDYYLPKQIEMAEIFTKSGRQFQHEVFKDMGHQYPEDEDSVINTALTFFEELN
jgi:predicted esterase